MALYPPIHNPMVPYIGTIPGGCQPGTMIQIQGTIPSHANRFAVNIQSGPNVSPRDDVTFHINADFLHNRIVRNSISHHKWGHEEAHGYMPLVRGQPFTYVILCAPSSFKLAINGSHFTDMSYRAPLYQASYLAIDGDVTINSIQYFGPNVLQPGQVGFNPSVLPFPAGAQSPYPTGMPGGHEPMYPGQQTLYPVQTGGYPVGFGHGGHNSYPHNTFPHGHNSHSGSNMLGMGGTGLGAGLVGATLAHKLSPKKALKSQKKAAKKALKYGVPIAGLGVGAYTVGRIMHRSSSSSSSSSSD